MEEGAKSPDREERMSEFAQSVQEFVKQWARTLGNTNALFFGI